MRTRLRLLAALAALGGCPAMAIGAPGLGDPVVLPSDWSNSPTALGGWAQDAFAGGLAGPATIQVDVAAAGSPADWRSRAVLAGPLLSGVRFAEFPAEDLEGRFDVRLVVDGANGSPLILGTLQLDRTAPVATSIFLTPAGGLVEADWIQSDALSGTDPGAPVTVEVNAGPLGDAAGPWIAFRQQPEPGDGRKLAHTDLAGLPDGRHLVRARTRDRAGNATDLVLGAVVSDRTPPVLTGVRVARPATAAGHIAEIAYSAADAGVGMVGAPRAQVALPGAEDAADLVVSGASGLDRVAVLLPRAGVHVVTVRVRDALGNRVESAPLTIRVPTPQEEADRRVEPAPRGPVAGWLGDALGPRLVWAVAQVHDFQAQRGLRLHSPVLVARTASRWRGLLGTAEARNYTGYATFRGELLIGPAATRGLDALGRARRDPRTAPSHADLDAMIMGVAVLLHESLHALGPRLRGGVRRSHDARPAAVAGGWPGRGALTPCEPADRGAAVPARLSGGADLGAPDVRARDPASGGVAGGAGLPRRRDRSLGIRPVETPRTGDRPRGGRPSSRGGRSLVDQPGTAQRAVISVPASMPLTARPAAGRIRSTSCGV